VRRSGQARPGGSGRLWDGRLRTVAIWGIVAVAVVVLALIVGRPPDAQAGRTSTPAPSTPQQLAIMFGRSIDPATNTARGSADAYRPGDTLAYSVTLPEPLGVIEVLVAVERVADGGRTTVQEPTAQTVDPARTSFGVEVPADRLLAAWGPGTYLMSVMTASGEQPVASGRFKLETP